MYGKCKMWFYSIFLAFLHTINNFFKQKNVVQKIKKKNLLKNNKNKHKKIPLKLKLILVHLEKFEDAIFGTPSIFKC